MLIGNVLMQFYNVADTYVVGNFLGTKALAAVGASGPVIFALVSFIIGIANGCTIIIAQYFGAKNLPKVQNAVDTVIIFVLVAAFLITLAGLLLCDPLLRLVNTPADVIDGARTFYYVSMAGIVPLFSANVLGSVLQGTGDSKTPLYYLIFSSVLNILLLLLFVPTLHYGIAGAAWATVLAQTVTVVIMVVRLNSRHPFIHIAFHPRNFDFDIFKKSVRIGLPNGIQHALIAVGMMALLRIVNLFNSDVLAAYSIAGRIESLASAPAMTFSAAIAAFVGQNVGAHKFNRVSDGLRATLCISILLSAVISLLIIVFRHTVMGWFTSSEELNVIEIGSRYLLIIAPFYAVFSTLFVYNGVMRGAGDTLFPMFTTLLSLWLIRIPFASVMSKHIGTDGIWWAIPIGWCLGAVCAMGYYRLGKWKNKGVVKSSEIIVKNDII
ncbi:MATE family efflux transporter [Bacteroidia bacterium]|nr:MATE family efflux transporter [Bacteroidia bacterium]